MTKFETPRLLNKSQKFSANHRLLTDCAHCGKPHMELTSRCVCRTPSTTFLSTTSVPITAGFIGFGYFLHAA